MTRPLARAWTAGLMLAGCLGAQVACTSTLGAGNADPHVESASDAMEDEETEEVFESINR